MRQLRRKLNRGKDLRIFCVKSWSLGTLILTAVSSIVSFHSYCFKMTPFIQEFFFKYIYISYAVWAFQSSSQIIYHLITKCNKKRQMYLFLSSYQQSVQMKIYSKKVLFYFVSLFACLQSIWIYHIWICLLSCITLTMNDFFYCAVWRAFCCTNVRKCYMCFFMHIQSILHLMSISILKAYSYCEYIYRM